MGANIVQRCTRYSLLLLLGSFQVVQGMPPSGCAWKGPPVEWIMSRAMPESEIAGLLGARIVPYLQSQNIPISFVSAGTPDPPIRLLLGQSATVRDALAQIGSQAPGFRYGTISERLVIYPRDT